MIIGSRVGTVGPGYRGLRGTVDVVVDPIVLTQADGTQTVGPPGELIVGTVPTPLPWGWLLLAGLGGLTLGYLLFEEFGRPRGGAQVPLV